MKNIFYKPLFWVLFFILSLAAAILTLALFPRAHSFINVPITMDRHEAITRATEIVRSHDLVPADGNTATNFNTDYLVQFFVELDAGGKEAFVHMIDQNLYQPYTWQIRFFKEHSPEETTISFTPGGALYGFEQKFSENTLGEKLSSEEARIIAEQGAAAWHADLNHYKLIETSKETVASGRIDHTFVYERPTIKIGEGFYRLRIKVSGNKMSELAHFVQVPESFIRKYTEMRSANDAIAYYAKIMLMLLYFLGCCIFGLLFLIRRHLVIWRAPIIWGIVFVLLAIGAGINQLPLAWMQYDTAVSSSGYLMQYVVLVLINACAFGIFFTIIFAAAESLSRTAFGNQIQLWRIWDKGIANSFQVLGRTLGAYLLVPFDLLFATIFYLIMSTYFGWWNPSSSLFDPNILATYFPWFNPLALSIQAGFWEECMFRAVPLSAAALLGNRYGKRNWWIAGTLILQALVFGAGHANYPGQPAIARVVELFLPSIIWGILYLVFGLLLVIVMHIIYDVLLFSLPLFVASGHHALFYQCMVIFLSLIPVWIVLLRRFQVGSWISLPAWAYNRTWQPTVPSTQQEAPEQPQKNMVISSSGKICVLVSGILGLGAWYFMTPHREQAASMPVDRITALEIAQNTFDKSAIDKTKPWNILPTACTTYEMNQNAKYQHRYIWQKGKESLYQSLMGSYLQSPYWYIRFAQFEGPMSDRAEEVAIMINNHGHTFRMVHELPEARPGKTLTEQEARDLAHKELKKKFDLDAQTLKEISAIATKCPERMDWKFTFADEKTAAQTLLHENTATDNGQLRIEIDISGDQLTDYKRYVHVPEEWERQEKNNDNIRSVIMLICLACLYLIFCVGCFFAAIGWTHALPLGSSFAFFLIAIFVVQVLELCNGYTNVVATMFNTSQPFQDQFIRIFGTLFFKVFITSAIYALLIAYLLQFKIPTKLPRTIAYAALGLCIGILFAGGDAILQKIIPSQKPLWADYSNMVLWNPMLGTIVDTIISFITITLMCLLIFVIIDFVTKHAQQRKFAAAGIFILFGFALSGILFADNIPMFLASGIMVGALFSGAYFLVVYRDPALIPLATAGYLCMNLAQQALYHALPSTCYSSAIGIIIILVLGWWWFKKLN